MWKNPRMPLAARIVAGTIGIGLLTAGTVLVVTSGDDGAAAAAAQGIVTQAPAADSVTEQWSAEAPAATQVTDVVEVRGLTLVTFTEDDEAAFDLGVTPQPAVVAYDADGAEVWRQEPVDEHESNSGNPIHVRPAAEGDLFLVWDGEQLRGVADDGEVEWTVDREVMALRDYGDALVVGASAPDTGIDEENTDEDSLTAEVLVLDPRTGEERHSFGGMVVEGFTPGGAIATGDDEPLLITPDGEIAWAADTGCWEIDAYDRGAAVAATDEQVVLMLTDGFECDPGGGDLGHKLASFDPGSGELLWEAEAPDTELIGAGPDGTVAVVESDGLQLPPPDLDGEASTFAVGDGTLALLDATGESREVALPGRSSDQVDGDVFDPWDHYDSGFVDVVGIGMVYLDHATGTAVTADLEVRQYDAGIVAVSTAGPYLVPDRGSLRLLSWEGDQLATVELADTKPDAWALDAGVLTFDQPSMTIRAYR